jgi:hypothetical protein
MRKNKSLLDNRFSHNSHGRDQNGMMVDRSEFFGVDRFEVFGLEDDVFLTESDDDDVDMLVIGMYACVCVFVRVMTMMWVCL